jgi:hypothetical protein
MADPTAPDGTRDPLGTTCLAVPAKHPKPWQPLGENFGQKALEVFGNLSLSVMDD